MYVAYSCVYKGVWLQEQKEALAFPIVADPPVLFMDKGGWEKPDWACVSRDGDSSKGSVPSGWLSGVIVKEIEDRGLFSIM